MHLQIAHAALKAVRHDGRIVADGHRALNERARHHRAEAVDREHAVDGQAEGRAQALLLCLRHERFERLAQLPDALARIGGNRIDGLILKERPLYLLFDILLHHLDPLAVYHVGLRDDDKPLADAEQLQNAEVLHRLRHEALVRRHDKDRKIDAARAGEHILDEFFMSRHIDDARLRAVVKVEVGKAQLDRNAALLFLDQPVGVNARERLDKKRLSVVYMARGADDNVFHLSASRAAEAISS